MLKKLKNKKGFTLIEIIVVIVILAVLMAVAVPSVMSYINEGNNAKYETAGRAVYTAVQTEYAKEAADANDTDRSAGLKAITIKKSNLDDVNAASIKYDLNDTKSNIKKVSCTITLDGSTRGVTITANKKVTVSDNSTITDPATYGTATVSGTTTSA